MNITKIAFASYPVTDIARARKFYEGLLGLKPTMDTDLGAEGHWVEYDIGTGTLGIGKMDGWNPSTEGCTVALEVDNFDTAVAELKAAGVPFRMGPMETPVCHILLVSDPDGSPVMIHKRKPTTR